MIEELVKEVHPNRISFFGGLMTAIGVPMLASPQTDIYGAALITLGQGVDCIDGSLARRYHARTKEGARLDPLLDKFKSFMMGSYIMAREIYQDNFLLPLAITANYVADYASQRIRGPIMSQLEEAIKAIVYPSKCEKDLQEISSTRANIFGKLKASFQNIAFLSYIFMGLYQNHIETISQEKQDDYKLAISGLFATSAVLGSISVLKRIRLKLKEHKTIDKAA